MHFPWTQSQCWASVVWAVSAPASGQREEVCQMLKAASITLIHKKTLGKAAQARSHQTLFRNAC